MLLESLFHFIISKIDPCDGGFQLQDLLIEVIDLWVLLSYLHRLRLDGCRLCLDSRLSI